MLLSDVNHVIDWVVDGSLCGSEAQLKAQYSKENSRAALQMTLANR
jgi:hypothetical protein